GRVEVVAPPGASAAAVQRFVGAHREWIDRRVEDLSAQRGLIDERRPAQIHLPAVSRCFTVQYEPRPTGQIQVRCDYASRRLQLSGPLHDDAAVARGLREWFMKMAGQELPRELARAAHGGGFRFARVQIRRQRTRWGSCSASGTISLNACVLFLEPAVMRYLLIHELAHTRHMNHSRRCWSLVEAHEPEYRRLDRELVRGWRYVPGWVFV